MLYRCNRSCAIALTNCTRMKPIVPIRPKAHRVLDYFLRALGYGQRGRAENEREHWQDEPKRHSCERKQHIVPGRFGARRTDCSSASRVRAMRASSQARPDSLPTPRNSPRIISFVKPMTFPGGPEQRRHREIQAMQPKHERNGRRCIAQTARDPVASPGRYARYQRIPICARATPCQPAQRQVRDANQQHDRAALIQVCSSTPRKVELRSGMVAVLHGGVGQNSAFMRLAHDPMRLLRLFPARRVCLLCVAACRLPLLEVSCMTTVKVNGANRSVKSPPDTPLLYVLRNELGVMTLETPGWS